MCHRLTKPERFVYRPLTVMMREKATYEDCMMPRQTRRRQTASAYGGHEPGYHNLCSAGYVSGIALTNNVILLASCYRVDGFSICDSSSGNRA